MNKNELDSCTICQEISDIKNNKDPYFITELTTGFVTLGNYQFYQGYTIFLCKIHSFELHELQPDFKKQFLADMSLVAESVYNAFKPRKLNYELLGNTQAHLHWHIFPRYANDPLPNRPIWCMHQDITCSDAVKPSSQKITQLKSKFLKAFAKLT